MELGEIVVQSAGDQLKQAPGVSIITSEDIAKQPPSNDLSEIIRKMPGVNLTGTSASGQRGNNRQIDIRGMGPENTLILIDGKPVLSRNSVRMGRAGERDSRGDTNWVPPEAVERIEVIRGPAAARYGSGASGGVVNIITKRPTTLTTSITGFTNVPESSLEGRTARANVLVGGPLSDKFSFRLLANYSKTEPDDPNINRSVTTPATAVPPAGREGVINQDVMGLLTYHLMPGHDIDFEGSYSRQGNIYTGDRQLTSSTALLTTLANEEAETNTLTRKTLSATHRGTWNFGNSLSYLQWEHTDNMRNLENLSGGAEGAINTTTGKGTIELNNIAAKSEWNIPVTWGVPQVITFGSEFRGEWMHDGISNQQTILVPIAGTTTNPVLRDPNSDAQLYGLYVENNIRLTEKLTLTPGLRGDYHTYFGGNLSPSLNASYSLTEEVTIKAGIARAFKAPNLYQLNPNYVYYTMGNGCPVAYASLGGGCYVVGNPDLEAETSVNKEIGINYRNTAGWNAGITYFHNDYHNRIQSGLVPVATSGNGRIFRWENVPEAVVSGLEGNLSVPISPTLTWSTNATYMIESRNKTDDQPLSLVPDYTINTWLDWQVRDDFMVTLSATHYGETKSPTVNSTTLGAVTNPEPRDPYTIVSLGARYEYSKAMKWSFGVKNLFNEQVLREGSGNDAGANTYNEPGRSYYVSGTVTF